MNNETTNENVESTNIDTVTPATVVVEGSEVTVNRKSAFKGVSWSKRANKWQVIINLGQETTVDENGVEKKRQKSKSVGLYLTELEAAKAYNDYIVTNQLNKALNDLSSESE